MSVQVKDDDTALTPIFHQEAHVAARDTATILMKVHMFTLRSVRIAALARLATMARRRSGQPIITEPDIAYLLGVRKVIGRAGWRVELLGREEGSDIRGSLSLGELPAGALLRGTFHLYSRQNPRALTDDWSTGLIFTDLYGHSYPMIRCNGPHGTPHTNYIERTKILLTPHIHKLTERYQQSNRYAIDGYAETTNEYSNINEAIDTLVDLANISTPPIQGTL